MKIWPSWVGEVWTISSRGSNPSWIAWLASEKAPVITAWLAITVAAVDKQNEGHETPARGEQVEGVLDRLGVVRIERALAEIVADQRGQNDEEPRRLDRPPPEMAHIGVKRLSAGHGEKDGAEHDEPDRAMGVDETQGRPTG